jgi:hypothetical protein
MAHGLPSHSAEELAKWADLYQRLAAVARYRDTSTRLSRLADRFAGEAARLG